MVAALVVTDVVWRSLRCSRGTDGGNVMKLSAVAVMVLLVMVFTISSRLRRRSGSSDRYEQPRTRLNFGQRAFSYAAWNSLPPTLQQMSNTDSFKRHLKTFLHQQAYVN